MYPIERDLSKATLWSGNADYDFYIQKFYERGWYVLAIRKGTNLMDTQAGFETRKSARHCAEVWATWMKADPLGGAKGRFEK